MHRFTLFYSLLIIIFAWGCNLKGVDSQRDKVFIINLFNPPTNLDPAFASTQSNIWVTQQIFSGLVTLNHKHEALPAIAKYWTISPDQLTYRFTLHNNVYFHPPVSRKVVAHDFVYSLTRICTPKTASPGQWIFNNRIVGLDDYQKGLAKEIAGFKALNDTVLEIRLQEAYTPFLKMLATPFAFVVPAENITPKGKEFGRKPIGCGAYMFADWQDGRHLILKKNIRYFQNGFPKTPNICFKFISNKLSAFLELQNGNIDFMESLDPLLKDEVFDSLGNLKARLRPQLALQRLPQLTTEYIGINLRAAATTHIAANTAAHILQNENLRKALNFAVNRQKIAKYLTKGLATPARGFIPLGIDDSLSNSIAVFEYSKDSALHYLQLAGYPNGKKLPILTLNCTPASNYLAEFIVDSWNNLGIQCKIEITDGGTLRQMASEGKLHLWRASWVADYPDPENFMSLFYSPHWVPNGPNATHFKDSQFDDIYRQTQYENNITLRRQLFQQLEQIIRLKVPVIPLFYYQTIRLYNNKWSGLPQYTSAALFPLEQVECDKNQK